jgi:hypothetical protein
VASGESAKIPLGEPVYRDAQHVIAVYQDTILTYSGGAPTSEYLDGWARTVEQVAVRFPTGILAVTIIDRDARAPDDSGRARVRSAVERHADSIRAFAYVVEGEGFGAAAVRSAVSLISIAARYPFPLKVFGRVEEAVPWVLSCTAHQAAGRALDAAKLIEIAHSLRGQIRGSVATG